MDTYKLFVIAPFSPEFADVYDSVQEAASRSEKHINASIQVGRGDQLFGIEAEDSIKAAISDADIIVADTSSKHSNVHFELGFAEALNKPVVVINQRDLQAPFNLAHRRIVLYDRSRLTRDLVPHLADAIRTAIEEPESFIAGEQESARKKPSAFVSYSHADEECLERMRVHLRPLVKQNLVNVWSDRKIKAGDKWREQIEAALKNAAIAVLLVSADFMASDFIIDDELPPLLAAAENKGTRILPVVLKPCRYTRDQHLSVFQALNDPTEPLLLLPEIEQEIVWDELAISIENEIESRDVI